jgi:hypothetical protein
VIARREGGFFYRLIIVMPQLTDSSQPGLARYAACPIRHNGRTNKAPLPPIGQALQFRFIDNGERTAANFEQTGPLKLAQNFADMNRGQSSGVRDVPLAQWKFYRLAAHNFSLGDFVRQPQNQPRNSFVGSPAA